MIQRQRPDSRHLGGETLGTVSCPHSSAMIRAFSAGRLPAYSVTWGSAPGSYDMAPSAPGVSPTPAARALVAQCPPGAKRHRPTEPEAPHTPALKALLIPAWRHSPRNRTAERNPSAEGANHGG